MRSGFDVGTSVSRQIAIVDYPSGRVRKLTNDFNDYAQVTTSSADGAIAAVRFTNLRNLWLADPSGDARPITKFTNPESSPFGVAAASDGSVVFVGARDRSLQIWSVGVGGGEPRAITSGDSLDVNSRTCRGRRLRSLRRRWRDSCLAHGPRWNPRQSVDSQRFQLSSATSPRTAAASRTCSSTARARFG